MKFILPRSLIASITRLVIAVGLITATKVSVLLISKNQASSLSFCPLSLCVYFFISDDFFSISDWLMWSNDTQNKPLVGSVVWSLMFPEALLLLL